MAGDARLFVSAPASPDHVFLPISRLRPHHNLLRGVHRAHSTSESHEATPLAMGVGAGLLRLPPHQDHLACFDTGPLDLTPGVSDAMALAFPKSSWGILMQWLAWGPHFL